MPRSYINEGLYWRTGFFYLVRYPLLLLTVACLALAVATKENLYFFSTLGLLIMTVISFFVFMVSASKVNCRLCRAQMIKNLACSKNKKARKLLGSYTLPIALDFVTRQKRIKCPYCGETHPYFGHRR